MDAASFEEHFLRSWLRKQEAYLRRLTDAPRSPAHEPDQSSLVAEVMEHQQAFLAAKCDLARHDAVAALSPPWLSPEALAGVWMGGWRPTAAVRLAIGLADMVLNMPALQSVREKIREEEERIEGEMERVQDQAVVAVVGRERAGGGEVAAKNGKKIDAGIERAAKAAEGLRVEALRRVVEVLEPAQAMDFLAAVGVLQLGLYHTGLT